MNYSVRMMMKVMVLVVGAALTLASPASGADTLKGVGTVEPGEVTYESAGETELTIKFPNQSGPSANLQGVIAAVAGVDVPADYDAAGIQGVTFTATSHGDYTPQRYITLVIATPAGELAINTVEFVANDSVANDISLAPLAGQLSQVQSIGVRITQNGRLAQSYTISDFQLTDANGDAVTPPMNLNGFKQDLFARFGRTGDFTQAMRDADTDKDGISDYDEILAGTDMYSENSLFSVEVVAAKAGATELRWEGKADREYVLMRANGIGADFEPVQIVADETNTSDIGGKSYVSFTDDSGFDNAIYKVIAVEPGV